MKDENAIPEVVTQDRSNVHKIIEEMLDNPDENGIYQTTRAFNKLEELLNTVRLEAVGWTWATACLVVDDGLDIRKYSQSKLIEQVTKDLNPPWVYDEDEGK